MLLLGKCKDLSEFDKEQQQHKSWLFYFWSIQLNGNNECLMPITVDIPSNKQYSPAR